jgi:RNA polymerase-binding transcription factor
MTKKPTTSSKMADTGKEDIKNGTSAEEKSHPEKLTSSGREAEAGRPSAGLKRQMSGPSKRGTPVQLSREELLKRQLIQHREEIVREAKNEIAKYIKGETKQLADTALDDGDWSVIDLSEDINLRRLETHRGSLLKIDEALRKIREGSYGLCEDCGEEISAARLNVMPFAIYCKDCQEKREEFEKIEREEL